MARKPKAVTTLHYLAVTQSLQAQNDAVMLLVQTVRTTLALAQDLPAPIREKLEQATAATEAAMWPPDAG